MHDTSHRREREAESAETERTGQKECGGYERVFFCFTNISFFRHWVRGKKRTASVKLDGTLKGNHRRVVPFCLGLGVLLHRDVKVRHVGVVVFGVVQGHELRSAPTDKERHIVKALVVGVQQSGHLRGH